MPITTRFKARARVRRVVAGVIAAVVAVLPVLPADATTPHRADLRVMTQNLYLGSSLVPALTATSPAAFVAAVAQIYATVQYTDFPARAEAIADEVEANNPDLIGLQEVTQWTTTGPSSPPGYDFLAILRAALDARGLHYSVAATADNASIGPVPLALPACLRPGPTITCTVQLKDRDVILVNDDTHRLEWSNPRSGRYTSQAVAASPVGPLSFDRGWVSIEARFHRHHFRFTTTHLETQNFPATQQAQAAEFLAGPGRGGTIIAVGDFNSASDGSTTTSYQQLTAPGKFRDAWKERTSGPGNSCCQSSDTPPLAPGALNNPVSTLRTRIDLILSRGSARADRATLVGDQPFRDVPPLWPSDHAGVIAEFRV
jgi:endonuclease/exonuclease/phosphatase family metal-dependent hydrolase